MKGKIRVSISMYIIKAVTIRPRYSVFGLLFSELDHLVLKIALPFYWILSTALIVMLGSVYIFPLLE